MRSFFVFPDSPLNQVEYEVVTRTRDRYGFDEFLPQILRYPKKEGYILGFSWPLAAYAAASKLLELVEGKMVTGLNWKRDVGELFSALGFLIMLVKCVGRVKVKNSHFPLADEDIAPQLLSKAWTLLQNWPENVEPFVRKNQSVFNQLAIRNCPLTLRKYRSRLRLPSLFKLVGRVRAKRLPEVGSGYAKSKGD